MATIVQPQLRSEGGRGQDFVPRELLPAIATDAHGRQIRLMSSQFLSRLLRIWSVIAVVDFLFAWALSVLAYGSTFTRLWQGVASVPLGPSALEGGARTVLIGIALHVCVALLWSTVFLTVATVWSPLARLIRTPGGVAAAAIVYGPVVWSCMSFVLVPMFTHRPPTITSRWWIQVAGHIPFVALPIVAMTARTAQPHRTGDGV